MPDNDRISRGIDRYVISGLLVRIPESLAPRVGRLVRRRWIPVFWGRTVIAAPNGQAQTTNHQQQESSFARVPHDGSSLSVYVAALIASRLGRQSKQYLQIQKSTNLRCLKHQFF
jgi:hypothetical protein